MQETVTQSLRVFDSERNSKKGICVFNATINNNEFSHLRIGEIFYDVQEPKVLHFSEIKSFDFRIILRIEISCPA